MIYDPELQTLAALADVQAQRFGNQPAVTCGEITITYRQLAEQSAALARALQDRGIGPGQQVALLSRESVAAVVAMLAIAQLGAVCVPINWRLSPAEVAFIAEHARCQLLLAGRDLAASTVEVPARCVVAELEAELRDSPRGGRSSAPPPTPRDPAVQLYTSGTSGQPKGVLLPHDSFFAIARAIVESGRRWMDWSTQEVTLCALPSFHIGGFWWLMRGLASGAHNVLLPQFVGWHAIEAIAKHRVTKAALVPAMLQVMLSEPDARPGQFTSLNTIGYGGSPISPTLQRRALELFDADLYQVYGLTETGNMAVSLTPDDHRLPEYLSAAGRALPGVELKVVDESGAPLPARGVGEVCIKSPAAMLGYFRDEAATRQVVRDGWLHTGDAGYLDEAGYLFISDRIKDMICSAGEKIWPAEVEAVLAQHPAVREIAVIGVPHADWGETVKAVAVAREPGALSLKDLRDFAGKRLAQFKLPSSLDLVEALPRTPAGKVQKRNLRASYWAAQPRQVG